MSEEKRAVVFETPRRHLYKDFSTDGLSLVERVSISKEIPPDGKSQQGVNLGRRQHPFDFDILKLLKDYNEHHSTCISAKTSSTVGLGFLNESEKLERTQPILSPGEEPRTKPVYQPSAVDETLNPLCTVSFHDVLMDVCEDFWDTGNGYIEVVRTNGQITGLHYLPAREVYIEIEDDQHNFHYRIVGEGTSTERLFCVFGDKDDFVVRAASAAFTARNISGTIDPNQVSEVIHFRRPSSRSKWYGTPDWVSAVPMIELAQMLHQYKFDFFNNRGVPEFAVFITGGKVSDAEWKVIEDAMKSNIGLGNSHKSFAVNLPGTNISVQVEKLAIEGGKDEDFKMLKETIALSVVTAHKVPPLLAGIQIPGKLGATNELSQALIAFQSLVIGQAQRLFQMTLARSLGEDESIDLRGEDFVFKTITDELDPAKMDTIGRMHQPLPQANAQGRDVEDGVRD
jgi:PBSX family phage portal protein